MEREMGLEPTTSSLGSWHSTAELLPLSCLFGCLHCPSRVFPGFLGPPFERALPLSRQHQHITTRRGPSHDQEVAVARSQPERSSWIYVCQIASCSQRPLRV